MFDVNTNHLFMCPQIYNDKHCIKCKFDTLNDFIIFSKKIPFDTQHNSPQFVFLLHVKIHKAYMTFEVSNLLNE